MEEGMRYCKYCGKQVAVRAVFCKYCGKKLVQSQTQSQALIQTQTQSQAQKQKQKQPEPQRNRASKNTGETEIGSFGASAEPEETDMGKVLQDTVIKPPITGLLNAIASFFGGIPKCFVNKKALLFAVLMTAIYLVWGILKSKFGYNTLLSVVSGFTLADSGTTGGVMGILSGLIGKSTAVAALFTVFSGGIKNLPKGFNSLFGNGAYAVKSEINSMLIGAGAAVLISSWISAGSPTSAPLAGIFAAVLSLEALGSREGQIYKMVQAFTSKQTGGFRMEQETKLKGVIAGASIGFAASTLLFKLGKFEWILGILLILVGAVLSIVTGKKGGMA